MPVAGGQKAPETQVGGQSAEDRIQRSVDRIVKEVNAFGIGSRVRLYAGGVMQVKEVRAGSGYQSQDDMRLHFGLGSASGVDSLVVIWPDGTRQFFGAAGINQFLKITR